MLSEADFLLALRAVQRGDATAAQVLAAIGEWKGDPAAGMAQRLSERQVLSAEARARLEGDRADASVARTLPRAPMAGDGAGPCLATGDEDRYVFGPAGEHYELGHGSGGKVLVALDRQMGRKVAVKELHPEARASADLVERFVKEARLTGQLGHPGTVPVYELGRRKDGTLYYTMQLVRGRTLQAALAEAATLRARLALLDRFAALCQTVAFAHSHGIVHRDLKPANVMLGDYGETILIDWGLAKILRKDGPEAPALLGADTSPTASGATLGTPLYMSPEQSRGAPAEVDERTDVWSLGVMLYELVTGRPPFTGATTREVLAAVREAPLVPMVRACPDAPRELASIAHKALERDPSRRYRDARAMAADVEAWLVGGRVGAFAYSSWDLLRRFAAKNVATVVIGALSLALLLAGLVAVAAARASEHRERVLASYHLSQALEEMAARAVEGKRLFDAGIWAAASLTGNPAEPGTLLFDPAFALKRPESAWLRVDVRSLSLRAHARPVRRLLRTVTLGERVDGLAFSPDGALVAAIGNLRALGVFEVATGREVRRSELGGKTGTFVGFSPDGARILTASGVLEAWEPRGASPARALPAVAEASAADTSPDGALLAVGGRAGEVELRDARTGSLVKTLERLKAQVRSVRFSRDGRLLGVAAAEDAYVAQTATGKVVLKLPWPGEQVHTVEFSPDAAAAVAVGSGGAFPVWDLGSGERQADLRYVDQSAWDARFSPDGRYFAIAGADGLVQVVDVGAQQRALQLENDAEGGSGLAFSKDGRTLAASSSSGSFRLWAFEPSPGIATMDGAVAGLAVSPATDLVATTRFDKTIGLWKSDGTSLGSLPGHSDLTVSLAVSPDGRSVASASRARDAVRLWDVGSRSLKWTRAEEGGRVLCVAFSPDGSQVAAAGVQLPVRLLAASDGRLLSSLPIGARVATDLAFSPDGKLLAVSTTEREIQLWDPAAGRLLRRFSLRGQELFAVAFSPDGATLAAGGIGSKVALFRAADASLLRELDGSRGTVVSLSFSKDGRFLAIGAEPGLVVVWDLVRVEPVLRLRTVDNSFRAAFVAGGAALAMMDNGQVWTLGRELLGGSTDPKSLLDEAERDAGEHIDGFTLVRGPR